MSGVLLMTNFAGPDQTGLEMLTFAYQLKGVDPRCAESWTATAANACAALHASQGHMWQLACPPDRSHACGA